MEWSQWASYSRNIDTLFFRINNAIWDLVGLFRIKSPQSPLEFMWQFDPSPLWTSFVRGPSMLLSTTCRFCFICIYRIFLRRGVKLVLLRYIEYPFRLFRNQHNALDWKSNPMNEWVYSDTKFQMLKMFECLLSQHLTQINWADIQIIPLHIKPHFCLLHIIELCWLCFEIMTHFHLFLVFQRSSNHSCVLLTISAFF